MDRQNAVRWDHRAGEKEVYEALERAKELLTKAWERLKRARRIALIVRAIHSRKPASSQAHHSVRPRFFRFGGPSRSCRGLAPFPPPLSVGAHRGLTGQLFSTSPMDQIRRRDSCRG